MSHLTKQTKRLQWLLGILVFVVCAVIAYTVYTAQETAAPAPEKRQATRVQVASFAASVAKPANWQVSDKLDAPFPVYTIAQDTSLEQTLGLHEFGDTTYVSFFPHGMPTEYPSGASQAVPEDATAQLPFAIDQERSRQYLLDSGEPFGYVLYPADTPENWRTDGFIVAYSTIRDFSVSCTDDETGTDLSLERCEPLMGDTVAYHGRVSDTHWQTLTEVLGSIQLQN